MPICPKCGADVPEDEKICPVCGEEMKPAEKEEPAAPEATPAEEPKAEAPEEPKEEPKAEEAPAEEPKEEPKAEEEPAEEPKEEPKAEEEPAEEPKEEPKEEKSDADNAFEKWINVNDRTADFDPKDIENNKAMGILAYIGILCLIPIFAAKNSPFARHHAGQGLLLFLFEIAFAVISGIGRLIGPGFFGGLIGFIAWIGQLCCLFFSIVGIINAARGQVRDLPYIGGIKLLK